MADDLGIYEEIASAVAHGREPDLSAYDPARVQAALERVLRFPVPRKIFLSWLANRARQLSGGNVTIEERPGADQNAENLSLPVRRVVAGEPFAEPAEVVAANPAVVFPMRNQ